MTTLIVATNFMEQEIDEKICKGEHNRIDYIELARVTQADYVDYRIISRNEILKKLEDRCRLDIRQALAVARLVKVHGYDTVISLSERVGIPLALLLPKHVRHFVIQHHPLSRSKIKLEKFLSIASRWEKIITISKAERASLIDQLGLNEEQVVSLNCPIDTLFYAADTTSDPRIVEQHVESLGLSHRDYPTLVRAMEKLPDIRCYFRIGSTWVDNDSGLSSTNLPSNVTLQPYVCPADLIKEILTCQFIIVPIKNFTQWSAGCTTVQIAQSLGKAVVASNLPGLRDYVLDNESGLLVKPEDPDSLADAIRYLWDNPAEARRMGERGRRHMEEGFSMEFWLDQISGIVSQGA